MFFENAALNVSVLLVLLIALTYDYFTKFFNYWYVRKVAYRRPFPFLGNNIEKVIYFLSETDYVNRLYAKFYPEKFIGRFNVRIPDLIVSDIDAIKGILTSRDFSSIKSSATSSKINVLKHDMPLEEDLEKSFPKIIVSLENFKNCISFSLGSNNGPHDVCLLAKNYASAAMRCQNIYEERLIEEKSTVCANLIALCLNELAHDFDWQIMVRQEINQILHSEDTSELNFDDMNKFKLLENVIYEALRLYSPYGILQVRCESACNVPTTDIPIDKGMTITIPIDAIHRDEQYFKNPERFDPERFSKGESDKVNLDHFIAFGLGNHSCSGVGSVKTIAITAIALILKLFKIEPYQKTARKVTLKENSVIRSPKQGIWLNMKRR